MRVTADIAPGLLRTAVAGLVWLALFSLLYTLGEENGAWPKLPAGVFGGWDLVIGLAAGLALAAALLWPSSKLVGSRLGTHVSRLG